MTALSGIEKVRLQESLPIHFYDGCLFSEANSKGRNSTHTTPITGVSNIQGGFLSNQLLPAQFGASGTTANKQRSAMTIYLLFYPFFFLSS